MGIELFMGSKNANLDLGDHYQEIQFVIREYCGLLNIYIYIYEMLHPQYFSQQFHNK